jgi:hypothetical protein
VAFVPTTWRKSSYSSHPEDNCVEVAVAPTAVAVRDSKNAVGPALIFGSPAWGAMNASFLASGVRNDAFIA